MKLELAEVRQDNERQPGQDTSLQLEALDRKCKQLSEALFAEREK
jgi:hypothetical protein